MGKTLRNLGIFVWIAALTGVGQGTEASTCRYTLDPNTFQVEWTAFKTNQKVAVNGSFTEENLIGDLTKSGSLKDLLSQLEAEITISDVAKIKTGNPARDQTLFQHFFTLFKGHSVIRGSVQKMHGSNEEGEFDLRLTMNQKTISVPMNYVREKDGKLTAKGSIDVLSFGLSKALESLHHTCEVLHRGPDGVSKTWPQVEIRVTSKITEQCDP